jgi:hypothetical protein
MSLVRTLFMTAARGNFTIKVVHIAGIDNSVADSLSRGQVTLFRHLVPKASLNLTTVPAWMSRL